MAALEPYIQADIILTVEMLRSAQFLSQGRVTPQTLPQPWGTIRRAPDENLAVELARALRENNLKKFIESLQPTTKAYQDLRDAAQTVRIGNAFIVGDAAGLASRDLCEGIGPAVRSAILAAEAIATGQESTLDSVSAFSLRNRLVRKSLEYIFVTRGLKLSRR